MWLRWPRRRRIEVRDAARGEGGLPSSNAAGDEPAREVDSAIEGAEAEREPSTPYLPAVMRVRRWLGPAIKRGLVPEGSVRRRWWWNRLFVQIDQPFFFRDQTSDEIYRALRPAIGRSAGVLAEAEQVLADERARGEHVERRATALQGAVAIAGTFVLAGAGFLLTTSRPLAAPWRTLIAIPYAITVFCLVATGLRALRATVRVHAFEYPDPEGPTQRATLDENNSELRRTAELLYSYSRNQPIIDYQVAQMRAAGHWFALALAGLLVTAAVVCAALLASAGSSASQRRTNAVARPAVHAQGRCRFVAASAGHRSQLHRVLALRADCVLSGGP
jgi:hypothetical protein